MNTISTNRITTGIITLLLLVTLLNSASAAVGGYVARDEPGSTDPIGGSHGLKIKAGIFLTGLMAFADTVSLFACFHLFSRRSP